MKSLFLKENEEFKHFQLCPGPKEARFLVDSILPLNRKKGAIFADCDKNLTFNASSLKDLKEELDFAWPRYDEHNQDRWQHEWLRHGSCVRRQVPELAFEYTFFARVTFWYTSYPFIVAFDQFKIRPGSLTYVDRIWHVLRTACGRNGIPRITCDRTEMGYTFSKVAICFDSTTFEAVSCGQLFHGWRGDCPKFQPIYVPFPYKPSESFPLSI